MDFKQHIEQTTRGDRTKAEPPRKPEKPNRPSNEEPKREEPKNKSGGESNHDRSRKPDTHVENRTNIEQTNQQAQQTQVGVNVLGGDQSTKVDVEGGRQSTAIGDVEAGSGGAVSINNDEDYEYNEAIQVAPNAGDESKEVEIGGAIMVPGVFGIGGTYAKESPKYRAKEQTYANCQGATDIGMSMDLYANAAVKLGAQNVGRENFQRMTEIAEAAMKNCVTAGGGTVEESDRASETTDGVSREEFNTFKSTTNDKIEQVYERSFNK